MELTPAGPETLAVNEPFYEPSYDDASRNSGQNVEQEMLHRRHLLVLKLGGCPKN